MDRCISMLPKHIVKDYLKYADSYKDIIRRSEEPGYLFKVSMRGILPNGKVVFTPPWEVFIPLTIHPRHARQRINFYLRNAKDNRVWYRLEKI